MKILIKGPKSNVPNKFLKHILNRINHYIARKNILTNPRLVIFSFDHIGLKINLDGRYEDSSLKLVENLISERLPNSHNEAVLDIGANIGNHSVFLSKFFKNVYAFEPNPITYEVLKINAKYASVKKNIKPLNFGLSNKETNLPFYISDHNMGASQIVSTESDAIKRENNISVFVKTADDVDEIKDEDISLIKIDIEGHEIKALKGAEKILTSKKPLILFEQSEKEIYNGTSQVINYLRSLGYKFYVIQKNFYFGENFVQKLANLILCSIFGEQYFFVEEKKFKKKYYDLILAIHE